MATEYVIHIGKDVLFLDKQKQPSEGFPAVAGPEKTPALTVWPLVATDVTGPAWDEALANYTAEQRASARVRHVVQQQT